MRRFIVNELAPKAQEYEDAHWFPNDVFLRLAEMGYLGLKFEERYGGEGGGYLADAVFTEELSHCGSGGLAAGIGAHTSIAMAPIWKFGTEDQKQRYLVPGIRGEKIGALGITEPDAGSDVAGVKTFAKRVDGGYVVNGSKMFITNGVRADFIVTAVKTTQEGGHQGLSFLIVDRGEGVDVDRHREARLARLRHGADRLRRRLRPRGEPARRGEPGLLPDHGQLPVGAADDGPGVRRRHAAMLRPHAGVREGAQGLRQADRLTPGDPPQVRRDGHDDRSRARPHLPRAAPVRGRHRRGARGDDGQAGHPARRASRWPTPACRSTAGPAT